MTQPDNLDSVFATFDRLRWIRDQFNTDNTYITQTVMYRAWLRSEITDALSVLHGLCWDLLNVDGNDSDDVNL